jgi:glycosyltransferase involved in cell wall biosynthesis
VPRVSVIIPAYNRAHLLKGATATVLAQTWTDFELIIVDDGSEDETRDVCMRLCTRDSRVRYIYQSNKGPNAARNAGVHAAQGRFIAFLDSDDLWEPTKLAKQLDIAETEANVGLVYCDWAYITEAGEIRPGVNPPDLGLPSMYESLLYSNAVHGSASAVLIRKECFDSVGLFDEALRYMEDWDMWLRVAQYFQLAKIHDVLVYLRQHQGQEQRNMLGMADGYLQVIDKISLSIPVKYQRHLPRARWHNQLLAAELYCAASARVKCWRTLILAINSWPIGLLSPRTWYVLVLSLTGPLYPQANAMGLALRKWGRRHLKMNTVTGWSKHAFR